MKDRALSIADSAASELEARNRLREYLQHVILRELLEIGFLDRVVFHGGTALRILYGLDRFSEDLDFHTKDSRSDPSFGSMLEQLGRQLEYQGYEFEHSDPASGAVWSCFLKFPGLLFESGISPHENEKVNIKLEVDCNPPAGFEIETSMVNEFFSYVVHHHDRRTFVAGKLHAIFQREWPKGRDFYDLLFYLTSWGDIEPNFAYLNAALEQTDWTGPKVTDSNWRQLAAERVEEVAWSQIRDDVEPFVLRSSALRAFEREYLLDELE